MDFSINAISSTRSFAPLALFSFLSFSIYGGLLTGGNAPRGV
jgi:hypothetical protein